MMTLGWPGNVFRANDLWREQTACSSEAAATSPTSAKKGRGSDERSRGGESDGAILTVAAERQGPSRVVHAVIGVASPRSSADQPCCLARTCDACRGIKR